MTLGTDCDRCDESPGTGKGIRGVSEGVDVKRLNRVRYEVREPKGGRDLRGEDQNAHG